MADATFFTCPRRKVDETKCLREEVKSPQLAPPPGGVA
jgi:hypothetical protein